VIDIGCGSGILTLAALKIGALRAVGVDIEEDALSHSRENARLNHLQSRARFVRENALEVVGSSPLILMNMISSEQRVAWESQAPLHSLSCTLITSGILTSQREAYLDFTATQWGWKVIEERVEEEWMAFVFYQNVAMSNSRE
jgi:ribosomal protein L11 methyltransferase